VGRADRYVQTRVGTSREKTSLCRNEETAWLVRPPDDSLQRIEVAVVVAALVSPVAVTGIQSLRRGARRWWILGSVGIQLAD
jgi:hypothetical protein